MNPKKVIDDFESVMLKSVERRLRADVPVVAYLSGGVDSSTVVALASHVRKSPIPTFTVRIEDPKLDEVSGATETAKHVGTNPIVVNFGDKEAVETYPRLIAAAEGPVIDTSCASLLLLARKVHSCGYKVALTGEGSDEWLAGYPWYKIHKILRSFDLLPGWNVSHLLRKGIVWLSKSKQSVMENFRQAEMAVAGPNPWLDLYGMISLSKFRFFSREMFESLGGHLPYDDLDLNVEKMKRWHPLNRGLCVGARVLLPGLLLQGKGDRVAMHSSVETRYPFLDEDVFAYLAKLHPRWKLRRFREKYILRRMAERWIPKSIAWRRKVMFRAPFDSFHLDNVPPYIQQLLSEESLKKTRYFDPQAVRHWSERYRTMLRGYARTSVEMGLVGVLATQLWHHLFIDSSLADIPGAAPMTVGNNGVSTRTAEVKTVASLSG